MVYQQNFKIDKDWIKTPLGRDIFFIENKKRLSGLFKNDGRSNFTKIDKAKCKHAREFPAICNWKDKFIFLSGGDGGWRSVEKYDIADDKWEVIKPEMSIVRRRHSSCSLGNYIYVICGYNCHEKIFTNSIERLDVSKIGSDMNKWTQINSDATTFLPRAGPAVAAIN